jgi:hypothetical protein
MAVRLSALRPGHPLLQEDSWYSFLLEVESNPEPELEGSDQLKNAITSSGIETATFRLVA